MSCRAANPSNLRRLPVAIALLIFTGAMSCQNAAPTTVTSLPPGDRSYRQTCGNWQVTVTLYTEGSSPADPDRAAQQAMEEVTRIAGVLDANRPQSEISQVHPGPKTQVSDTLFNVLWQALELARRTEGAFDPTRIDPAELPQGQSALGPQPTTAPVTGFELPADWRDVSLESIDHTVELRRSGLRLDLGQLATGSAADAALAVLRRSGISRALVQVDRTAAAGDAPPGRTGWRVETPGDIQPRVQVLKNSAVGWTNDPPATATRPTTTPSGLTGPFAATVRAPSATAAGGLAMAAANAGPDVIDEALRAAQATATFRVGAKAVPPAAPASRP